LEWQLLHRRALRNGVISLHRPFLQQSLHVQWEIPLWRKPSIHSRSECLSGQGLLLKPEILQQAPILSAVSPPSLLLSDLERGRSHGDFQSSVSPIWRALFSTQSKRKFERCQKKLVSLTRIAGILSVRTGFACKPTEQR
jgi:hypothetical protein